MKSLSLQNYLSMTFIENRMPIVASLVALVLGLLGYLLAPSEFALLALVLPLGLVVGIVLLMHPEILLVMIVILIPFESAPIWDELLPAGLTMPKILGAALLGAFFFHVVFRKEKFRFLDDAQDYAILLFCAAILFSVLATTQFGHVFSQMDRVFRLFAFYVVVKNVVKSPRVMFALMVGYFLAAAYTSGYGINEYNTTVNEWGKKIRAAGIGESANTFAMYSVFAISIGIFLFQVRKNWLEKAVYAIGIAVIAVGLFYSGSRGGALAFLTVLAVLVLRHPRGIQFSIAAAAIVVLSFPFWPTDVKSRYVPGLVRTDFQNSSQESVELSSERRKAYLDFGLERIVERPIIGSGYRTFSQLFTDSDYARFNNPLDELETFRVAHNVYLETAVGLGLIGLFALVAMMFIAWRGFYMAGQMLEPGTMEWATARGLELALIGYAVSSIFITSDQYKLIWLLMGMSSALLYYARAQTVQEPADDERGVIYYSPEPVTE